MIAAISVLWQAGSRPHRGGRTTPMTNIVVLIKQVPDDEDRKLTDGDWTLDRAGSDPVLDEINEKAVEVALQLKEKHADADYKVVVLTAGPSSAETAIRRA